MPEPLGRAVVTTTTMDAKKSLILFTAATSGRKPGQPTALVPHNEGVFTTAFFRCCATTIRTQEHVVIPALSKLNP